MENNRKTIPEQAIEAGWAFTKVLEMENEMLRKQFPGSIKDSENIFSYILKTAAEELAISRGKLDVPAQHYLDELQKAKTDLLQSFPETAAAVSPPVILSPTEATNNVDKALIQALSNSLTNTVTAQQQANILHQAAITHGIMQIHNVCAITLAVSINEYFNKPPLS